MAEGIKPNPDSEFKAGSNEYATELLAQEGKAPREVPIEDLPIVDDEGLGSHINALNDAITAEENSYGAGYVSERLKKLRAKRQEAIDLGEKGRTIEQTPREVPIEDLPIVDDEGLGSHINALNDAITAEENSYGVGYVSERLKKLRAKRQEAIDLGNNRS